jgi:tetratricopeptide (TPR) repeat protein
MIQQRDTGMRRWQEEVARDPGSPAFVPLADLYRVQGRLDVAKRVCLRGLERHPHHVEGHYLLGRIYRDGDDPEKAYDEWDIALRLDPHHPASRRAIAFLCLEQSRFEEAERHLGKALENDPDDPRILRALGFLERGAERPVLGADYWDAVARMLQDRTEAFAREARVRMVTILDTAGRVLTQHGFTRELDLAAFASLAAAVQAAARELARMSGQPDFSQLYQGRAGNQLFLGTIPAPTGDLLLLTVFGEETTIGLVRALFTELAESLREGPWPAATPAATIPDLETELAEGLLRVGRGAGAPAGRRG